MCNTIARCGEHYQCEVALEAGARSSRRLEACLTSEFELLHVVVRIYIEEAIVYLAIRSQLRSSAGVLESIIWCFRTRVAPFELDITNPDSRRPEASISTFQSV